MVIPGGGGDWETVGISKFQVRRKTFVLFLIEIGGLMITSLREKIDFLIYNVHSQNPHPHNVHLTLCVEKSICESF